MTIENLKCPECEGPMTPRTSKHGKFWGCKAFPKCKGTRDSVGESPKKYSNEDNDKESDSFDWINRHNKRRDY